MVGDLESAESFLKDTELEMTLSGRLAATLLCRERNPCGKAHRAEDGRACLGWEREAPRYPLTLSPTPT